MKKEEKKIFVGIDELTAVFYEKLAERIGICHSAYDDDDFVTSYDDVWSDIERTLNASIEELVGDEFSHFRIDMDAALLYDISEDEEECEMLMDEGFRLIASVPMTRLTKNPIKGIEVDEEGNWDVVE